MRFNNDKDIRNLPQDKKAIHKDILVTNLYIEVRPKTNGVGRTFYFRYNNKGKILSIRLGKYPQTSLAEARAKAIAFNDDISNGMSPKNNEKQHITLQEAFDEWHKINKSENDKDFAGAFKRHILSRYKDRKIAALSKKDIIIVFDKLSLEKKRETIKRAYSKLKSVLTYCINREYIEYSSILFMNIPSLYGKIQVKSFRAITDKKKFKELLQAIDEYSGSIFVKVALQMSPYLFLRSSNMRNLEWQEVDLENKRLLIPANKTKGRQDFIVPLSPSVIRLFEFIKPFSMHSKYVFPSDFSKSKSISENTLNIAIKRLGFGEDMVYHGFRSTASTFLYEYKNIHKQDSEVIELCLDHRERNKVKGAYNRSLRLEDRSYLMNWWSDFIDNLKAEKD